MRSIARSNKLMSGAGRRLDSRVVPLSLPSPINEEKKRKKALQLISDSAGSNHPLYYRLVRGTIYYSAISR
jgi:hypothetical protein